MRKGWTETTLGEIATLSMGRTPSRSDKTYWTENLAYPFCTIADMDGKFIFPNREGVTNKAIQNGKAKIAPKGTLLMSFKLTIGRMGFAGQDIYPNEAIVSIIPNSTKSLDMFLYYLLGFQDLTAGSGRAIKGETLNSKSLLAIPIFLPPLSEQKRIVDVMSSVDAYIDALQQQSESARLLRSSIAESIAKSGCSESQLLSLGRLVTGSTPSTKNPKYWAPEEVMFLTPGDFAHRLLISETARMTSLEGANVGRLIQPNSVVQVCIGATIGKVGMIEQSLVSNQQINALEGLSADDAYFASLMLSTHRMQSRLIDMSGKTTMPIISKSAWGALEIPWPSSEVRKSVADAAESIDSAEEQLDKAIMKTLAVRSGLLSDLLSGNHEIPASYDSLLGAA